MNFRPDRFDLPEHNEIWWSMHCFRQLERPPDLLIFGSSLMLAVTNNGDATYLKQPLDGALHHQSFCLEENLSRHLKKPIRSYSFAVGGQMASDAYAIERTMIDKANRPQLVVWGIAPRDLVDAAFDGAASSDTARYMNKIAGAQIIPPGHRSLPAYIDKAISRLSYLYQMRTDFVCVKQNFLRELRKGLEKIAKPASLPFFQKALDQGGEPPQEIEIGDRIIGVCTHYPETIKDNTREYRKRYNPFKLKTLIEQASYLERFLSLNRELGSRVVLVNMPLTAQNQQLMPIGLYDSYLSELRLLASKYGAEVLDLNSPSIFSSKEFFDTAHLNGLGGEKLARLLSSHLNQTWPNKAQAKDQCR